MTEGNEAFPPRLDTVQAMRGIAALLVLFLHTAGMQRGIIGPDYSEAFNGFWNRGFAGVDMFFVISGFIMVYVTRDTQKGVSSALSFFKARVARIYPLWWFYAGAMALIYFVIFGVPARPEYANEAGGVAPYLFKSFMLLPQGVLPIIDVGWTLIYEMYFYLVFAVILLLPRRLLPAALGVWAIQILLFQFLSVNTPLLNVLKSPLSFEFIGGASVALLILHRVIWRPKLVLTAGCFAFAVCLMLPEIRSDLWGGWGRVILFGAPSLAIIYGFVAMEHRQKVKPPRWSVALGNWSYSLYLGHVIVLIVMKNVWEVLAGLGMPAQLVLGAPGIWDNATFALCSIFAAIFAAMLSYYIVERPLARIFHRSRSPRPS